MFVRLEWKRVGVTDGEMEQMSLDRWNEYEVFTKRSD